MSVTETECSFTLFEKRDGFPFFIAKYRNISQKVIYVSFEKEVLHQTVIMSDGFKDSTGLLVRTPLSIKKTIWVKVFKNGPSKICGRQSLKNLK